MRTVLAALDTSPSAAAVLDTALRLGELTGAAVEAVHVRDGPTESLKWLTQQAGVDLRLLEGPVRECLPRCHRRSRCRCRRARSTGDPSGRRRAIGSTALHVLELTDKPVTVVPPDIARNHEPFHRLLVPLEGSSSHRPRSSTPCVPSSSPTSNSSCSTCSPPRHPAGDGPPEPRPGDVGQRVPRPELPERVADRAPHRIDRLAGERRMPGRRRRPHRAELVTEQLARTGGSDSRRARPRDRPRAADSGEMTRGSCRDSVGQRSRRARRWPRRRARRRRDRPRHGGHAARHARCLHGRRTGCRSRAAIAAAIAGLPQFVIHAAWLRVLCRPRLRRPQRPRTGGPQRVARHAPSRRARCHPQHRGGDRRMDRAGQRTLDITLLSMALDPTRLGAGVTWLAAHHHPSWQSWSTVWSSPAAGRNGRRRPCRSRSDLDCAAGSPWVDGIERRSARVPQATTEGGRPLYRWRPSRRDRAAARRRGTCRSPLEACAPRSS